jgi:hypothetical protein
MMQLSARQRDLAACWSAKRAGSHALHAYRAIGIGGGVTAHQIFTQHDIAAARHDISEHIAVDGDVAAFDHALLLHVAKLLVLAGELQIACGGAVTPQLMILGPIDKHLLPGSTLKKPSTAETRYSTP